MLITGLGLRWSYWRSCSGLNINKKLDHVFHTSQADRKTESKGGAVYSNIDSGYVIFSDKQTNGETIQFLIRGIDETPVPTYNRLPWWQCCQLLFEDLRNFISPLFSTYFLFNYFHKARGVQHLHATDDRRTTYLNKYRSKCSQIQSN